MTQTVYPDLGRRVRRRRLAFSPQLWLVGLAQDLRHGLRMWSSRNQDRAYLANLSGAELEHVSRDLGRPMAELRAEARPRRGLKTGYRR